MVNRANTIEGQFIDHHPFNEGVGVYVKGASVLAAQADQAGVINTPEGRMTFQAGDWILTDNPPTHAWPVRQQVFEATFSLSHRLEDGQYPTGSPDRPGRVAKSAPPANANQKKAESIGMAHPGAEDAPRVADSKSLGLDDA